MPQPSRINGEQQKPPTPRTAASLPCRLRGEDWGGAHLVRSVEAINALLEGKTEGGKSIKVVYLAEKVSDAFAVQGVMLNAAELGVTTLVETEAIKEGTDTDGWAGRLVPGRRGAKMIAKQFMMCRAGGSAPSLNGGDQDLAQTRE